MNGLSVLVIWIVLIIIGACALFAGFFFLFQSNYVYHPDPLISANPGNIGLHSENVSFETSDGVRLSGWFIPKENASGVILFCHGNAGNISHRLETIQNFHELGLIWPHGRPRDTSISPGVTWYRTSVTLPWRNWSPSTFSVTIQRNYQMDGVTGRGD